MTQAANLPAAKARTTLETSHMRLIALALLIAACGLSQPALAAPPGQAPLGRALSSDPARLAATIDRRLQELWQAEQVEPAPMTDDAEFLRRVSLDIAGRIPSSADVYAFLEDPSADKRTAVIDRLLDSPRHAQHFANLWRAELLPEVSTNPQARELQFGFERWLTEQFRGNVPHDQFVRSLIAIPLPGVGQAAEPVLRDPQRSNPLAFIAAKDARPENLAAAVTRTFLGIRLECAQCHDHPFAAWTREQFWSQAAFFAGLKKSSGGLLAPLNEVAQLRAIAAQEGEAKIEARFLTGDQPAWTAAASPRDLYAEWLTSSENHYFAKAAVNRLWGQFFGTGIVHPVDDFHDANPPSDELLLDTLAAEFVQSGFDARYLIRAICLSKAYQQTSAQSSDHQAQSAIAARMTVKALTPEQLYDSFILATRFEEADRRGNLRREFLSRFAQAGELGEPTTSVQQALTLLNGALVAQATDPQRSPALIAIAHTPRLSTEMRIEALYVTALGRRPTAAELSRLQSFVAVAGEEQQTERLADIFWMLLNSLEFRVNH